MAALSQRIYIVGAGAIGAFFAARLSPLVPTTVIVKNQYRDLYSAGIQVRGAIQDPGFRILDIRDWGEIQRFEPGAMIWVTTKIFDLPQVLEEIGKRSDGSQTLLLLQNGLGVAELAQSLLPGTALARAVCWFGVRIEPLHAEKRALLHLAGVDSIEYAFPPEHAQPAVRFATLMQACGIPPVSISSVEEVEWRKSLWNVSANGLCAVAEAPNGAAATDPFLFPIAEQLYEEAAQVARARGLLIGSEVKEQCFGGMRKTATNLNSTLMDLRAGRRTEMEWLNGAVVRMGQEAGLPCPTHRVILNLVRSLESSQVRCRN